MSDKQKAVEEHNYFVVGDMVALDSFAAVGCKARLNK